VRARNLPGEAQHCREQTQENERRSRHARSVQAMSIPQARNLRTSKRLKSVNTTNWCTTSVFTMPQAARSR
jgi:hypothetical protein